jgi:mannose/fructose/N-acetylgalactosamine-specific phosphotransferase system component IID
MTEPTSTTVAVAAAATGVGLTALFPTVDGNALIGSFAGSILFFLISKEPHLLSRFGYAFVSLVMGYFVAPELVKKGVVQEMAVAAFLASTCVVTVTLALIEKIKTVDVQALLAVLFRRP